MDKQGSEPWFDKECEAQKNNLKSLSKRMKNNPDEETRRKTFDTKKQFKKIILAKKRRYRGKLFETLQGEKQEGNKKEFWKILRKISPKSNKGSIQPNLNEFRKYFEKLSKSDRALNFPDLSNENGPLDHVITQKELEDAGCKLKLGKSAGDDNMSNEMIISLLETHPKLILKLFNLILQSGEVIPEWLMGLIVAIYKDGPKMDPGNYRGITLMSCLGKLFLSVLNSRLMNYVLGEDILTPSALGFVPGNRTSDALIIINNLVKKICHKQNKKLFSCFVDFRKAFDRVPRDLLLKKLLNYGITGKFFNIIRSVYLNDQACVKANGVKSLPFDINIGVRQGCVLSPLLFNVFICDLAKKLMDLENAPEVGPVCINSLFWADDLVLFSKDEEGLQKMLNVLEEYCKENELTINTKKTKCMIFNKTGRLLLRPFFLNGVQLEMVRSYKYLGFLLTPSGELNTGLKDLRDRAFRAFMKIKNDLGSSFNQDVPLVLSLINSLVKPILLYACDFWGCFTLPVSNPIDNLYMSMLKQILGVQKQTTNVGVLLELGMAPIRIEAKKLAIKNWERIKKSQANILLLSSYQDAIQEELPWINQIKSTLESNGFLSLYIDDHSDKPLFVFKKLSDRLNDIFTQEAFEKISKDTSKLRTYALFKKEKGFESYLTEIKNFSVRKSVTRFRLSNHKLLIEVGRHQNINLSERICPLCSQSVEDEAHFLFACPAYQYQRELFLNPTMEKHPNFVRWSKPQKIELIMSNMDHNVCNYISRSMEIRDFLSTKPKRVT